MKKGLSLLLIFAMLLLSLTVMAEVDGGMPGVGGVINGFALMETRDYPLIGATIYRFEHQRTGAEVFYIANGDTNRVFQLTFRTEAIDNTGLPHVFEHATLAGSEKYPSKDLWFNLANGSYNTYMNAYTAQNHTGYPVASLSEAQLLKFADFYTDSCLHPMVLQDESIFREEAWRYRMNSPEAPLTIEGTVYSEMQGSLTLDQQALYDISRLLLPGSYDGNVSGGDPDCIPDMTYEALKAYHERYYHPSNCVVYLYGRLDRWANFLRLLDDAFAPYERREFAFEDPGYAPLTAPVEQDFAFPVEEGGMTENASSVSYGFVCPGLKDDPGDLLKMVTLSSLLNDASSGMSQAMERALPDADWGCALSLSGPEACLLFICDCCDIGDKALFKGIVDEQLAALSGNPFPEDMLDAMAASLEISKRLIGEYGRLGLSVIEALSESYMDTGNPWQSIEANAALDEVKGWNAAGVYGQLVEKYLIGSERTALCCTYPAPGEKERKDAALAERLAEVKAGMSEAEIDAIVAASNAPAEENPDTAAMIAELTAVTVHSLPEEVWEHPVSDTTDINGVRHVEAIAEVDGIGVPTLLLDLDDLPQEDILWLHLYADMIGELDTTAHTHEELDTLWDRYLYNGDDRLSLSEEDEGYHLRLRLDWIALDEDLQAGYDLMWEILFDTRFDDMERISDLVSTYVNAIRADINDDAYSYQLTRALGRNLPAMRFSDYYAGVSYYQFLRDVLAMCETDPGEVTARLEAVQRRVNNGTNAIVTYSGSAEGAEKNCALADAFIAKLDRREIVPAAYDLPTPALSEAMIVDTPVQYNGIAADFESLGTEYSVELEVVTQLVTDLYLLPELRARHGAYGVEHFTTGEDGIYIYSYRDPNIRPTFEVYEALPEFLENLELDQETLDHYILSIYQGYNMAEGPLSAAETAIAMVIEDLEDESLQNMRALKAMTPETVKGCLDMYRALVQRGSRFTAGGASAVNEAADLYDAIINPFGAADLSSVALSDVPEDSPLYDDVRDVFEQGLMTARADGSFGVDAPATVSDLAFALCQLIEEPAEPGEAVDILVDYGILPEDVSADDVLAPEACRDFLDVFTQAIGLEWPGEPVDEADPFTRGNLAHTLAAYCQWLDAVDAEAA